MSLSSLALLIHHIATIYSIAWYITQVAGIVLIFDVCIQEILDSSRNDLCGIVVILLQGPLIVPHVHGNLLAGECHMMPLEASLHLHFVFLCLLYQLLCSHLRPN